MDEQEKQADEMPQLIGDEHTHDPPPEVKARGHEGLRINTKAIIASAAGLLGLLLFGMVVSLLLMQAFGRRTTAAQDDEVAVPQTLPLEAPEAANLAVETQRQRQAMRQILQSYGWVQEQPAVARIPINQAIDLIAEQGFQPWGGDQESTSGQGARDASP